MLYLRVNLFRDHFMQFTQSFLYIAFNTLEKYELPMKTLNGMLKITLITFVVISYLFRITNLLHQNYCYNFNLNNLRKSQNLISYVLNIEPEISVFRYFVHFTFYFHFLLISTGWKLTSSLFKKLSSIKVVLVINKEILISLSIISNCKLKPKMLL